jgi:predicted PurR-regulated permease PerM
MLTLVNLLILFFTILVIYQIFLAYFGDNIIEGLTNTDEEYKPYDSDPMILARQNAGNIIVIKGQLDDMLGLKQQVQDLSSNVISLQSQVTSLVNSQNDYANQMTGGTEPQVSGTTSDETTTDDTTDQTTDSNLMS